MVTLFREWLRRRKIKRATGCSLKQLIRLSSTLIQRDDEDWTEFAGGLIKNIAFMHGSTTISVTPDRYYDTTNVTIYVEVGNQTYAQVFNTAMPDYEYHPGDWQPILRHLYKSVKPK